jgi:hypothetical protein
MTGDAARRNHRKELCGAGRRDRTKERSDCEALALYAAELLGGTSGPVAIAVATIGITVRYAAFTGAKPLLVSRAVSSLATLRHGVDARAGRAARRILGAQKFYWPTPSPPAGSWFGCLRRRPGLGGKSPKRATRNCWPMTAARGARARKGTYPNNSLQAGKGEAAELRGRLGVTRPSSASVKRTKVPDGEARKNGSG